MPPLAGLLGEVLAALGNLSRFRVRDFRPESAFPRRSKRNIVYWRIVIVFRWLCLLIFEFKRAAHKLA